MSAADQTPEQSGPNAFQKILALIALVGTAWLGWTMFQQAYLVDKKRDACDGRFAVANDAKMEVITESLQYKDVFVLRYKITGDGSRVSTISCYVTDHGSYVSITDFRASNSLDLWVLT